MASNIVRGGRAQVKFQGTNALGLDVATLETPARTYAAAAAHVEGPTHRPTLIFWQPSRSAGETRSLLEVTITRESVVNFKASTAEFMEKLADYLAANELQPKPLTAPPKEPPVGQAAAFTVRVIRAIQVADEACMDFYDLDPWEVERLNKEADRSRAGRNTGNISVEPIVRVKMASELAFNLIDQIRNMK